jgi:hypothetical protein
MAKNDIPRWLKIEGETVLLNSGKTAEFFGVTVKTLAQWAKEGCPKHARGWWNPKEILAWRGEATDEGTKEAMSVLARKLKAEADYKEARAESAIRQNEILEGQYMPKDEIETQWARRVIELKTGLLALGNKIAGQITDPDIRLEVERVINDEVYELLEQYARDGSYTPKATAKVKSGKR